MISSLETDTFIQILQQFVEEKAPPGTIIKRFKWGTRVKSQHQNQSDQRPEYIEFSSYETRIEVWITTHKIDCIAALHLDDPEVFDKLERIIRDFLAGKFP